MPLATGCSPCHPLGKPGCPPLTKRKREPFDLKELGRRRVEVDFSAGRVSSDGGGLLLREVDGRLRLTERLAHCFGDHRRPELIEHTVQQLLAQRIYGVALGYEDLSNHERLSRDPLVAAMVGKIDVEGLRRARKTDVGKPLASPSTLGRIERREHCYLPLYAFCGGHPLAMKLRPSDIDGAKGADEMLMWIVWQLRAAWPEVRIILRADSGFCRDWLMTWCEDAGVDYVLGLARNDRLTDCIPV